MPIAQSELAPQGRIASLPGCARNLASAKPPYLKAAKAAKAASRLWCAGRYAAQANAVQTFIENAAWAPHLALAEARWALDAAYARKPAQIAKAVELQLGHTQLTAQDAKVATAALEIFRTRASLCYSGCVVLEIARKTGHLLRGRLHKRLAKIDGKQGLQTSQPAIESATVRQAFA